MSNRVITINRMFGSNGRIIGKALAEELGFKFYDKELIEMASKEKNIPFDEFARVDERKASQWLYPVDYELQMNPEYHFVPMNDVLYDLQKKIILEAAEKENCVIVGRCGNYILQDNKDKHLSLFIYAPFEDRVKTVIARTGREEKSVRKLVKRTDKERRAYYEYFTDTNWPDTDVIRKETDEVYNRICEDGKFKEVMDVLLEFAEKLRLIVWSMTAEGNKPAETVEKETDLTASELTEQPEVRQKIIRAYVYEREFRRIKALPDFKKLLAWLNENQINLRQFKHKISIVFQNARDGELNLLFTGDAQPEHLKMIAENYDGKLPLYEHYWCIKVPHHGTQGHYFDFSQYEPENMLISNGIHFANSKKESKELRTSPLYGGLFYIPDTHMYCSNCDCCDSYENGCSCKEADVISPAYYKDI